MDLGKHILAAVVGNTEALKKFLGAGLDMTWMTDKADLSRAAIFGDNTEPYLFILRAFEKNGEAPSWDYFEHSFPPESHRLPEDGPSLGELIDMAVEDRTRVQVDIALMRYGDMCAEGSHNEAYDFIQAEIKRIHQSASGSPEVMFMEFDTLDDTPLEYRVDGIWPEDSNLLLSAYAKTGKTTLILHLLRALSEGDEFFGRKCHQVNGTVVYVNLELGQQMLRKYAVDAGIDLKSKHLKLVDLRGRATSFKFTDAGFREKFAAQLREVECEVLVIDPLSPIMALAALDSNSPDDSRRAMEDLGTIASDAGADLVIVDHTGHADRNRPRGATAKMDWADVLWNLQSVSKDETDPGRHLKVTGRLGVMADTLYYRMEDGGLVTQDEEWHDGPSILSLLSQHPEGQIRTELVASVDKSPETVRKELVDLERKGLVRKESGRGNKGDLWYSCEER